MPNEPKDDMMNDDLALVHPPVGVPRTRRGVKPSNTNLLSWATQQRRVNDLVPLGINPRKISEGQRMKMIESLQKFNLVDIPVIDEDGTVISGHQRLRAMQAIGRGDEVIDVRTPNRKLTDKEVKEYNLLANTHYGEFDLELLEIDFADIDTELIPIDFNKIEFEQSDIFDKSKANYIKIKEKENQPQAQEDDYDIPDEIKTDIVLGDLFEIGPHRLLCGDSTDSDQVAKLMGGEKADMVFTDPPYGLGGYGGRKNMELKNDDASDDVIASFYSLPIYYEAREVYLWGNATNLFKHIKTEPRDVIVWRKNNFGLGCGYRGQYELCFYYGEFNGSDSDVWDVDKDTKYQHPTQKPVALCERAIKNSNPINIKDLFMGSGSTMVAAHQLNRRCYGMELDTKYCQVIVDRMIKLDPTIEIKRNGQPYQQPVTSNQQ